MRSDYSAHNGRVGNADKSRAASSEDLVVSQLTGSKGPVPGHVSDRRIGEDRRHHRSILGFIYGNFRPRRRLHRRKDDEHFFWFDWHEPKILYIALAIVLLSCTDALFTLNLLKIGAVEANLFMDRMLSISVESFLWVKIGMTSVAILILVFASQRRLIGDFRVLHLLCIVCAGYVVLIGYEVRMASKILGVDPLTLFNQLFIA